MGILGRWRQAAHAELARVRGLVALLMKPRNGEAWTPEDRALLRRELLALARLVPVFVLPILPGSVVLLPAYAWLLDRRRVARTRRETAAGAANKD